MTTTEQEDTTTATNTGLDKANDSIRAAMLRQQEILNRKKAKKAERERAWRAKYG